MAGERRWCSHAAIIGLLALLGGLTLPGGLPAAPPAAEVVLDLLQLSGAQRRALTRGAIVSYPVTEHTEREIAAGLVMLVASPLHHVAHHLEDGALLAQDSGIAASGLLPDPAHPEALPGVSFAPGERREAEALLDAEPGTRFNLSPAEIETLRRVRNSLAAAGLAGRARAAADEYRRLLRRRWLAYRQGGLAAVAPYARAAGALTDPAVTLRFAAGDALSLADSGPALREALLRYPEIPAPAVDRFYWIKRQVQGRPAFSLLHQMVVEARPGLVVHVERSFYVGHSYNTAQMLTAALAHAGGALVLSTSRISTDEVLGLGNQLKRSIGRGQLREDTRRRLERFRASLTPPAPPTPIQSP